MATDLSKPTSGLLSDLNPDEAVDFDSAMVTTYDGAEGIFTYAQFRDDKIITNTIQDNRPILEGNYLARKDSDENWNMSPELKHVATIPLALALEWEKLGLFDDMKALLKALEIHKEFKRTTRRL